ncbi:MAG: hypothetical protein KDK76_00480 [Chlamydiia bacterium]|nr:hypothetical protein [Chlamydiia bacterium]
MQDLPQQTPDYEVVLPLDGEESGCVIQEDPTFRVIEAPTPPMVKLEEKDLFSLAHYLHTKYEKGFTWGELPEIMTAVIAYVGPNPEMTLKEKKKAAIEVIHYLMVSVDPLYLPEKATDPFFEELIHSHIELAFTLPTECVLIQPSRTEPPSEEALTGYADHLYTHFEEGLSFQNLTLATHYSITHILSYQNLSMEEQIEGVYTIIDLLLSKTDSEHLLSNFDEKLYKIFLRSFIREILHAI